jgi:hypothetical protein
MKTEKKFFKKVVKIVKQMKFDHPKYEIYDATYKIMFGL